MREAEDGGREGWWHFKDGGGWWGWVGESGGYGNSASSPLTHLPGLATLLAWVSSHRGNSDITAGTGGAGLALLTHLVRFSQETNNLAPHRGRNKERGRQRKKKKIEQTQAGKKKKKRFCSTKKKK